MAYLAKNPVGPIGTPATNVTAVEYGDGRNHCTVLTLSAVAVTTGNNASLGVGSLLYTLPAGAQEIDSAYVEVGLTLAGTPTAQTPVLGLGTTIASGAVSVLSGTAAFQNIMAGAALADIAGTVKKNFATPTSPPLYVATSGGVNHTIYLNFAVAWASQTSTAATANGTVTIYWRTLA